MQTAILSAMLVLIAMESCASFLVYPRILESRADDGSLLLHIDDGLTLSLEKTSILAEDFIITSSTGFDSDAVVLYGRELEKNLYHDKHHQSTLVVMTTYGGLQIRGMLNPELRIAPVVGSQRSNGPTLHEVVNITERAESSSEQPEEISNTEEPEEDDFYANDDDEMNIDLITNSSSEQYAEATEESPVPNEDETNEADETQIKRPKKHPMKFTVETCFVLGPKYESAFKTIYDLIQYIAAMLNAVALRFLDMTHPKVRFQLNKVIRNMSDMIIIRTNNGTDIDAEATLDTMKEYARRGAFSKCDMAVLLTSEDLVLVGNSTIGKDIDGMAFIGRVCGDEKVGVAEDRPPTYDGVGRLAHEMAHILGANHDNTSTLKEFPGYPGAENCSSEDGYLMSYRDGGRKKYRLSNCSKDQIRFIYRNLSRSCINVSREACYSSDSYPGQNMTRRQFCKLLHLGEASAKPARKNAKLHLRCQIECCWKDVDYGPFCRFHSMAEGLKCAPGKTCRRGACAKHNWKRMARSAELMTKKLQNILPNKAV
ncbi:venom metalloproteinase BumaMPs1-like isoform X6 [Amblyomma americanum]